MLSTGSGDKETLDRGIHMAFNPLLLNRVPSAEVSRLRGEYGLGQGTGILFLFIGINSESLGKENEKQQSMRNE